MKLQPKGIVTLNLDKFAGEAFAKINPGKIIPPIHGMELSAKYNTVLSATNYVVYLHGVLDDPQNWVLTASSLSRLQKSDNYSLFMYELFMKNIVLFVGINIDDIALSRKLLQLNKQGLRPPALYWLTTRLDSSLTKWASELNISLINYQAIRQEDHLEYLKLLVESCLLFVAADDPKPAPQVPKFRFSDVNGPTNPIELAQLGPEQIRKDSCEPPSNHA